MKVISNNILFRLEKFGGILINKLDFNRIELNRLEASFLYLVQNNGFYVAKEFFDTEVKSGQLDRILSLEIYENIKENFKAVFSPIENLNYAQQKMDDLKKRNILSFPLELIIYPSMYCDLKCGFCFLANRKDKQAASAKEWKNVLTQAKENGVLSISILGGEPTRYYDIDNLLLACDELEINTTITTNAQNIKDSTIKIIEKSKYIIPVISLQSLDEHLNFELMGVRPTRQMKLAEYYNSVNKKCRINCVYTKQTYKQIEDLVDFCEKNKIDRFSIANYSEVTGYTKIKKQFNLTDLRHLNEHIEKYINEKEYHLNFATEGCHLFTAYPELINNSIHFSEFNEMYYGCRAKYTKMEILSNGEVLPCIAFLGVNEKKQNVFSKKLIDIWHDDILYNGIRNFRTNNAKCLSCGLVKICEGGCYVNLIKYNHPEIVRDTVCEL